MGWMGAASAERDLTRNEKSGSNTYYPQRFWLTSWSSFEKYSRNREEKEYGGQYWILVALKADDTRLLDREMK